ncbi:uncharacterized protein LOC131230509, partial [Magnolia sinica]|uniref:uncharacterized protein LOC131230509 n=1 Tax=Magnolia sinica TaxID=86752 RepID=UPI00265A87B4
QIITERKAWVNAAWEKMNSGISVKTPKLLINKSSSTGNKTAQKYSSVRISPFPQFKHWMANLGLLPKKASSGQELPQKRPASVQNGTSKDVKRLAAAALSAVKDAAAVAAGRGKVEVKHYPFKWIWESVACCFL